MALALFPAFQMRTISEEAAFLTEFRQEGEEAYVQYVAEHIEDEIVRQAMLRVDPETYQSVRADIAEKQAEAAAADLFERQTAELESIRQNDPGAWLSKLEEWRPERYAEVISSKEAETARLDEEVERVPASDLTTKLELYALLSSLNPDSARYAEKFNNYSAAVADRDWKQAFCTTGNEEDVAGQEAKHFVKQTLKAPRTAKFPFIVQGEYQGDCLFVVRSYVDAENSFGAMIRTHYKATLLRTRGGWGVVALETD